METEDSGVMRRIGPYRIDGVLGRGGMGEVLAGYDEALRRPVAIKRVVGGSDGDARARFWREARALAALRHPGVVTIHQIDEDDEGELFIAMERIEGRPLRDFMEGPWPRAEALGLARQAAEALGAAHAAGLVHRDVKPSNLLLQPDGHLRVVDFGLARKHDEGITATGARIGTPAYMAPEQIEGDPSSPATDVFALGVVLYRLLAGAHPFARDTRAATTHAILAGAAQPLASLRPDLPKSLTSLVARCLSVDAKRRPADGAALAEALEACGQAAGPGEIAALTGPTLTGSNLSAPSLGSLPAQPRRLWPWALGGALLVLGAVAWWGLREAPPTKPQPAATGMTVDAPKMKLDPLTDALPPLPPRPAIAVHPFEAEDAETGAVLADAIRRHLLVAPKAVVARQWQAEAFTDPARLTRKGRAPGHIDLLVRGRVAAEAVEVELVDTVRDVVRHRLKVPADPKAPVRAARAVSGALLEHLGAPAPKPSALPRPEAWRAFLAFLEASKAGAYDRARSSIDWALKLDPSFAPAALGNLNMLRAERRDEDLKAAADALVAKAGLGARDRAMAEAWKAYAHADYPAALRALHGLVETWPYDTEAFHLILALRFHMPGVQDMVEAERVARRILEISPRDDGAASRLVRSLSFRGRVDEAERVMRATGVPETDPDMIEVWGELHLWAERYPLALARFQAALEANPDDLYAEHMGFATLILAGQCEEAAVRALARISRIEARGKNANLGWTYSLALQAIMCQGRWDTARALVERWAKKGSDGGQVVSLRPRIALASGLAPAVVAAQVVKALKAKATPTHARTELLRVLARVAQKPKTLKPWIEVAESGALDLAAAPGARRAWLRAKTALRLRKTLLEQPEAASAKAYAALTRPWSAINAEWMLGDQVEALVLRAEAFERIGQKAEARRLWGEVADLGYPRLWMSDLWYVATQRR